MVVRIAGKVDVRHEGRKGNGVEAKDPASGLDVKSCDRHPVTKPLLFKLST